MTVAHGARDDEPLDPALREEIRRIVSIVAARFARAWRYLEKSELENEGWKACLPAVSGFNPAAGPAEAYFRVIARRAMGKFCSRTVAAVSMGKKVAEGAKYQARAELTDWNHGNVDPRYAERLGDQYGDHAELAAMRQEEDDERLIFIERVRELVDKALIGWDPWDRYVVNRLNGLDGYQAERPADLATRLKVPVRRIYRIHGRLEKAIWRSPDLYNLHKYGRSGG